MRILIAALLLTATLYGCRAGEPTDIEIVTDALAPLAEAAIYIPISTPDTADVLCIETYCITAGQVRTARDAMEGS